MEQRIPFQGYRSPNISSHQAERWFIVRPWYEAAHFVLRFTVHQIYHEAAHFVLRLQSTKYLESYVLSVHPYIHFGLTPPTLYQYRCYIWLLATGVRCPSGGALVTFRIKYQAKNVCVQVIFVCVEVLRPSQPNGVMSSAVSLPNHTFTGQA